MNFAIVKTHVDLLKYVEHLQSKNSDSLGFLPRVAFEQAASSGRLFLGLLNNEPCGYILAGSGYQGILRCPQVCIQYDARRRLYGAMLVAAVEKYGESIGCHRRAVRCGSDLDANSFWASVGYYLVGTAESGASRRYRRPHLNLYTKPLFPAGLASWDALRRDAGRKGGEARSPAKIAASRENGKRGGRPRNPSLPLNPSYPLNPSRPLPEPKHAPQLPLRCVVFGYAKVFKSLRTT